MATKAVPGTSKSYRDRILECLEERNLRQRTVTRIFSCYASIAEDLRRARSATHRNRTISESTGTSADSFEVQRLREELTILYRQKGETDQGYIDASRRLSDCETKLAKVTEERDKLSVDSQKLCARIAELEHAMKKLNDEKTAVHDEWLACNALVQSQQEKIRKLEDEQITLINKIRELNEQKAEFMNDEIKQQQLRQQRQIQEAIARAVVDVPSKDDKERTVSVGSMQDGRPEINLGDAVPTRAQCKFEANDGEVNDVAWISPDMFATAGSDRKIRIWRLDGNNRQCKMSTLTGCNQTITRLDSDSETRTILGSSNDHAVRLWNVDSQRLMSTFAGHSDKVTTVKYYHINQAVSGSSDRSIKIWDLRSQRCVKTFFPGSTIHDIIGRSAFASTTFYSGHYDKKIRIWDGRTNEPVHVVEMAGKITSLDVSYDGLYILCSSRDDSLSLIDVRNYHTVHMYSAEQYRTSYDFSRCVLSPSMQYCAAGSSDGRVFVWNVDSTKIEKILHKGGHEVPVLSVRWRPTGWGLLSADKQKNVVLWEP